MPSRPGIMISEKRADVAARGKKTTGAGASAKVSVDWRRSWHCNAQPSEVGEERQKECRNHLRLGGKVCTNNSFGVTRLSTTQLPKAFITPRKKFYICHMPTCQDEP